MVTVSMNDNRGEELGQDEMRWQWAGACAKRSVLRPTEAKRQRVTRLHSGYVGQRVWGMDWGSGSDGGT